MKKENYNTRLTATLAGENERIASFAIITLLNFTKETRSEFEVSLKKKHHDYIYIKEKNDLGRTFYFLINVNIDDITDLCSVEEKCKNTFIYGQQSLQEKTFSLWLTYYQKKKNDKRFIKKASKNFITTDDEAKDFFSRIRNKAFAISFSIFDIIQEGNVFLESKYGNHYDIERVCDYISEKNIIPRGRWTARCFITETFERKIARYARLKESCKQDESSLDEMPEEYFEFEKLGLI